MDPAAAGAVAMPTMDLSTVGRTRDEEQAVLEELSGTAAGRSHGSALAPRDRGHRRGHLLRVREQQRRATDGAGRQSGDRPRRDVGRSPARARRRPASHRRRRRRRHRAAAARRRGVRDRRARAGQPPDGAAGEGSRLGQCRRRGHRLARRHDRSRTAPGRASIRVFAPRVALPATVRVDRAPPAEASRGVRDDRARTAAARSCCGTRRSSPAPMADRRSSTARSAPLDLTHGCAAWVTDGDRTDDSARRPARAASRNGRQGPRVAASSASGTHLGRHPTSAGGSPARSCSISRGATPSRAHPASSSATIEASGHAQP